MTAIATSTVFHATKPAVFGTVKAVARFIDGVFLGAAYVPERASNSQLDQIRVPR